MTTPAPQSASPNASAPQATLTPSRTAIGPNTYLTERDFMLMVALAVAIHAVILGIASIVPMQKVTNIPVRAISFKLGDAIPMEAEPVTDAGDVKVEAPIMQAVSKDSWQEPPPETKKTKSVRETGAKDKTPKVVKVPDTLPSEPPMPLAPATPEPPAVATTPQQYVREVGAAPTNLPPLSQLTGEAAPKPAPTAPAGPAAAPTAAETAEQATLRARYEQEISSWIQKHKFYPAQGNGKEGRAIIRLRIDRGGAVRYYAIEESSGLAAFDDAALDMIRRANPVPAVPDNYPSGNLIEFLIPISFKAPQ